MDHPTNLQSTPVDPQGERNPVRLKFKNHRLAVRPLDWAAGTAILLISVHFFAGLASVPFHPDESTHIYMSSDFERFFQNPTRLFWSASPKDAARQAYRELDAPLLRDLIGLGRWLNRSPALATDWNWSKTWDENRASGALPTPSLLLTARVSADWVFPIALFFIYLACRNAGFPSAGFIAVLLLGLNPVLLLHTRRAMAEGILFFGVALILLLLSVKRSRGFLLGASVGIAICAKQSAVGLLPAAALAGVLSIPRASISVRKVSLVFIELAVGLFGVYGLLNPFLWSNPIAALQDAAAKREVLRLQQISDFTASRLNSVPAFGKQLALLVGEVYLVPPQFEEAGNYTAATLPQQKAYLEDPLNTLLSGPVWAGVFLFLTLVGMVYSTLRFSRSSPETRGWLAILAVATAGEIIFLCIALPLPFQRYTIPLFPLIGIWAGLGVESFLGILAEIRKAPQGKVVPGDSPS